jgi:hypothetical protein
MLSGSLSIWVSSRNNPCRVTWIGGDVGNEQTHTKYRQILCEPTTLAGIVSPIPRLQPHQVQHRLRAHANAHAHMHTCTHAHAQVGHAHAQQQIPPMNRRSQCSTLVLTHTKQTSSWAALAHLEMAQCEDRWQHIRQFQTGKVKELPA